VPGGGGEGSGNTAAARAPAASTGADSGVESPYAAVVDDAAGADGRRSGLRRLGTSLNARGRAASGGGGASGADEDSGDGAASAMRRMASGVHLLRRAGSASSDGGDGTDAAPAPSASGLERRGHGNAIRRAGWERPPTLAIPIDADDDADEGPRRVVRFAADVPRSARSAASGDRTAGTGALVRSYSTRRLQPVDRAHSHYLLMSPQAAGGSRGAVAAAAGAAAALLDGRVAGAAWNAGELHDPYESTRRSTHAPHASTHDYKPVLDVAGIVQAGVAKDAGAGSGGGGGGGWRAAETDGSIAPMHGWPAHQPAAPSVSAPTSMQLQVAGGADANAAASLTLVPAWFAAQVVYAAACSVLSPVWSFTSGVRAARQLLQDYAELKVTYREKKRTQMRREWIREDERMAASGVDTSAREMPNWDDLIPRLPHPAALQLEAATATLLRTLMEAAHAHRSAASNDVRLVHDAASGGAAPDTSSDSGLHAVEHAARVAVLEDFVNSLFNGASAV
jgi:hypothetical protein